MCGGSGAADGQAVCSRVGGALGMRHRGDPGAQRGGEDPGSGGVHGGGRAAGQQPFRDTQRLGQFWGEQRPALPQLECLDPFSEASGSVRRSAANR